MKTLLPGLLCGLLMLKPTLAQTPAIILDGDIRIFTTLVALRLAGFHPPQSTLISREILKEFDAVPAGLREKLQNFYQNRAGEFPGEDKTGPFISLALLSEGPPDFQLSVPLTSMPPDARTAYEFLSLVRQFYAAGRVEAAWSRYRGAYDAASLKSRPFIDQLIYQTNGYLRIASNSYLDRRLFLIPEFMGAVNTYHARNYRENYYLVYCPGEKIQMEEIRHQYLHFLLDTYPVRYSLPLAQRLELVKFLETDPPLQEHYLRDTPFMMVESLIRALELRMNKVPEPKASQEITKYLKEGAIFIRHFYDSLKDFETTPEGLRLLYPEMIKTLQFSEVKAAYEAARATPDIKPVELNPLEKLLKQASSQTGNEDPAGAQETYEQILHDLDPANGEALYGLGMIYIMKKEDPKTNREKAREHFRKALESPSSSNSSKAWSHIYLGRICDLEKNREEAIKHYQAALDLGDNARNALEVARKGLNEPFGTRK
jgi:tetratricopeptide (TPR) repeat protein